MTVESNLDQVAKELDAKITAALKAGADQLLAKSNALAPRDTGALVASGRAIAQGREAAVGYTSPYAIKHHQKLNFKHSHGQAKFLETAFLANRSTIEETIARKLGEGLQQ